MQPYFFIKKEKDFVRVNYDDLICIESFGSELCITTLKGVFIVLTTLEEVQKLMQPITFCRVSDDCMIFFKHIISFDEGTITLSLKKKVAFTQDALEPGIAVFGMEPMLNNN
jgi:DNA-binding LytR/AlgR family response regulator